MNLGIPRVTRELGMEVGQTLKLYQGHIPEKYYDTGNQKESSQEGENVW